MSVRFCAGERDCALMPHLVLGFGVAGGLLETLSRDADSPVHNRDASLII